MMHRFIACLMIGLLVAACTNPNDLDKGPVYLGDFSLGHNVVVAPNITKGPASRDASPEEWIESMKAAIDERFGPQEGDKLYHLGISVEGYVLAVTGVPIVASPKSALILKVTVWDDAAGEKLNEDPEQITVIESFSTKTALGSGLTQSKELQMENLSRNAAKLIQNWMVRQNATEGWFEPDGKPRRASEIAAENRAIREKAAASAEPTNPDATEASGKTQADPDAPAETETQAEPAASPEPIAAEPAPADAGDTADAVEAVEAGEDTLSAAEQATAITEVIVEPDVAPASVEE